MKDLIKSIPLTIIVLMCMGNVGFAQFTQEAKIVSRVQNTALRWLSSTVML